MTQITASRLVIEKMANRHIDSIRAIDRLCYSSPWSAATWRNELSEATRHHVVGRIDDTIVGHAGLLFVLEEVHVTTVAVHPDHQRARIATRLVSALLDVAVGAGSEAATLEVRASARRAQRLYARFGFRPAGVRRSYYTHPVDDAVVMWLHELQSNEVGVRLATVRAELTATPSTGEIQS